MKKLNTKTIVLLAMYVALSIALDYFKEMLPFLNMPQGGSVNIALIPVVVAGFHLGASNGLLCGALWWLITTLMGMNEWFVSVPQYVLDYILPSIVIGGASLFYRKKNIYEVEAGIIIAMVVRTFSIVLSGAYYWPDGVAAGSSAAWIGSMAYNLPYSIATMVMLMMVVPALLKSMRNLL